MRPDSGDDLKETSSESVDLSEKFTVTKGADGLQSQTYELQVAEEAPTYTALIGGEEYTVTLSLVDGVVKGIASDTAKSVIFTVSLDGSEVTLTMTGAGTLKHPVYGDADPEAEINPHDDPISINGVSVVCTVKDYDDDTATSEALALTLTVKDDGLDVAIADNATVSLEVDETAMRPDSGDDLQEASSESVDLSEKFSVTKGADGLQSQTYELQVAEDAPTYTALIGGAEYEVTLIVSADKQTVTGAVTGSISYGEDGTATVTALAETATLYHEPIFTVSVDTDGKVTLTMTGAGTLKHPVYGDADPEAEINPHDDPISINGVSVVCTVKDYDDDTATSEALALTLTVKDDGPNVNVVPDAPTHTLYVSEEDLVLSNLTVNGRLQIVDSEQTLNSLSVDGKEVLTIDEDGLVSLDTSAKFETEKGYIQFTAYNKNNGEIAYRFVSTAENESSGEFSLPLSIQYAGEGETVLDLAFEFKDGVPVSNVRMGSFSIVYKDSTDSTVLSSYTISEDDFEVKPGADGEASRSYAINLLDADSGQKALYKNQIYDVELKEEEGVVWGVIPKGNISPEAENDIKVFSVSVNDDGVVSLKQYRSEGVSMYHDHEEQNQTVKIEGKLSITLTVVDGDGDSDDATIPLDLEFGDDSINITGNPLVLDKPENGAVSLSVEKYLANYVNVGNSADGVQDGYPQISLVLRDDNGNLVNGLVIDNQCIVLGEGNLPTVYTKMVLQLTGDGKIEAYAADEGGNSTGIKAFTAEITDGSITIRNEPNVSVYHDSQTDFVLNPDRTATAKTELADGRIVTLERDAHGHVTGSITDKSSGEVLESLPEETSSSIFAFIHSAYQKYPSDTPQSETAYYDIVKGMYICSEVQDGDGSADRVYAPVDVRITDGGPQFAVQTKYIDINEGGSIGNTTRGVFTTLFKPLQGTHTDYDIIVSVDDAGKITVQFSDESGGGLPAKAEGLESWLWLKGLDVSLDMETGQRYLDAGKVTYNDQEYNLELRLDDRGEKIQAILRIDEQDETIQTEPETLTLFTVQKSPDGFETIANETFVGLQFVGEDEGSASHLDINGGFCVKQASGVTIDDFGVRVFTGNDGEDPATREYSLLLVGEDVQTDEDGYKLLETSHQIELGGEQSPLILHLYDDEYQAIHGYIAEGTYGEETLFTLTKVNGGVYRYEYVDQGQRIVGSEGMTLHIHGLMAQLKVTDGDGDSFTRSAEMIVSIHAKGSYVTTDILGNEYDNRLNGTDDLTKHERVLGKEGDDYLDGKQGADELYGGPGMDILVYDPEDIIQDGGSGIDFIISKDTSLNLRSLQNGGHVNSVEVLLTGNVESLISVADLAAVGIILDAEANTMTLDPDHWVYDPAEQVYRNEDAGLTLDVTTAIDDVDQSGMEKLSDDPPTFGYAVHGKDEGEVEESDTLAGTAQTDRLFGGSGDDELQGDAGDDFLYGEEGNDTLAGGTGNDHLDGGAGNDTLDGGTGNDTLYGGDGSDSLTGGDDNDYLNGGITYEKTNGTIAAADDGVADVIEGGDGWDIIAFEPQKNEDGTYASTDTINGGGGLDILLTTQQDLTLADVNAMENVTGMEILLKGDAALVSGLTNMGALEAVGISLDSASNIMSLDPEKWTFADNEGYRVFENEEMGLTLEMSSPIDPNTNATRDNASHVILLDQADDYAYGFAVFGDGSNRTAETIDGSSSSDRIYAGGSYRLTSSSYRDNLNGGDGNDYLYGEAGMDSLNGGNGIDFLDGGSEKDTLNGGNGSDILVDDGVDTINGEKGIDIVLTTDQNLSFSTTRIKTVEVLLKGDENTIGSLKSSIAKLSSVTAMEAIGILLDHEANTMSLDLSKWNSPANDGHYTNGSLTLELPDAPTNLNPSNSTNPSIIWLEDESTDDKITFGFAEYVAANRTSLYGTNLTDRLYDLEGDARNVTLYGSSTSNNAGISGDDSLRGRGGKDTLYGYAGDDHLDGGDGDDVLYGDEKNPKSLISGNDTLIGWNGDDRLFGGRGNDSLDGGEGIDVLLGGDGDDSLEGGAGNDVLIGDGGDKLQTGSTKNYEVGTQTASQYYSKLTGNSDNDLDSKFNSGNDARGYDSDMEGRGDDYLDGGAGDDILIGGVGNDTLIGGAGIDRIFGGDDDDYLDGGDDADRLFGGLGNDTLLGGDGNDSLNGGAGNDYLAGGDGADTLNGGTGSDILLYAPEDTLIDGGDDFINTSRGIQIVFGVDFLLSSDPVAFNTLGDQVKNIDVLLCGSSVTDITNLDQLPEGITVSELDHTLTLSTDDWHPYGDNPNSFENNNGVTLELNGAVFEKHGSQWVKPFYDVSGQSNTLMGTDGSDWIYGGDGQDHIYGGEGNDYLFSVEGGHNWLNGEGGDDHLYGGNASMVAASGGPGNDYIMGGPSYDNLSGDAGNDILVYDSQDYGIDGGSGIDFLISSSDSLEDMLGNSKVKDMEVFIKMENGISESDLDSLAKLDENYDISLTEMDADGNAGKMTLTKAVDGKDGWIDTGSVYEHYNSSGTLDLTMAIASDTFTVSGADDTSMAVITFTLENTNH